MDSNRVLGSGETILVMGQGRQGKTVSGTRVFTSWHDFEVYALENMVSDHCDKPVGTILGSRPLEDGRVLAVTKQGHQLTYGNKTVYIASDREDPKRWTLKVEDFGLTEGKYGWVKPKP